jgi:asparagine synthetase B (glutamine-hydrolysing)
LDTDLLQFCLSIPLEQTINAKMHRRLMRLATADILPSRVRLRTDKSRATVPITFQRLLTEKRALLQLIEQAEYPGNNRRIYRTLKQLSDTANRQRPNANLLMRQINFCLWLLA